MGEWRLDQAKGTRRYVWGQTRGEQDALRRDFLERMKAFPVLNALRVEKIGSEIHLWRELKEEGGKSHWISCLRFESDDWGYWKVYYRLDERRWRSTALEDLPIGRAIQAAADFFQEKFVL